MIERVCSRCGSAWGKDFKFCPADGVALVVSDALGRADAQALARATRFSGLGCVAPAQDEAAASPASPRMPSPTRVFGPSSAAQPAERAVDPVFTRNKSRAAAAFVTTEWHQRPGERRTLGLLDRPGGSSDAPAARTGPVPRKRFRACPGSEPD